MAAQPRNPGRGVERVTLITPTRHRPARVAMTLQYYADQRLPSPIHIDDASDDDRTERVVQRYRASLNLVYRRRPESGHMRAYGDLLETVTTPYVLMAGDDDFFPPDTMARCVSFLDERPSAAVAMGTVIHIQGTERADGSMALSREEPLLHDMRTIGDPSPAKRLWEFSWPTIYFNTHTIKRTTALRDSFHPCVKRFLSHADEWTAMPFLEVAFNALALIQGTQHVLPGLFHVWLHGPRPVHPGYVRYDRMERLATMRWAEHLPAFTDIVGTALREATGLSATECRERAEAAWLGYLIPWLATAQRSITRRCKLVGGVPRWRRALVAIGQEGPRALVSRLKHRRQHGMISWRSLRHPSSPYHAAFNQIERALARSPAA